MRNFFSNIFSHPITWPVIAGVIATVIGGLILTVVPSWWTWTSEQASRVVALLLDRVSIPLWLLVLVAVIALWGIWGMVRRKLAVVPEPEPEPTDTVIDGVRWRWTLAGSKVSKVVPYCVEDDMELKWVFGAQESLLKCQKCSEAYAIRGLHELESRDLVAKEIEHRMRTNKWQD